MINHGISTGMALEGMPRLAPELPPFSCSQCLEPPSCIMAKKLECETERYAIGIYVILIPSASGPFALDGTRHARRCNGTLPSTRGSRPAGPGFPCPTTICGSMWHQRLPIHVPSGRCIDNCSRFAECLPHGVEETTM